MLFICARRDKTTIKAVYRLTDEVPYLFVFRALLCPYLIGNKATKQITAFGHWGQRFCGTLQNLCFPCSHFQCLPPTEKR